MPGAVGRKLTRRQALVGTAMLVGAAAVPDNGAANALPWGQLLELGTELDGLRRRCAQLQRQVGRLAEGAEGIISASSVLPKSDGHQQLTRIRKGVGYDRAWEARSTAVDRSLELAGRIRSLPADDLAGWSAKYRALMWELFEHDSSPNLSEHQLRPLRRLASELQRIDP